MYIYIYIFINKSNMQIINKEQTKKNFLLI